MQLVELDVNERVQKGSSAMGRLRRAGFIPGVIYAEGKDAQALEIDAHHYQRAIGGKGSTQLFKLKSKSSSLNGLMALIKSVQIEPLKQKVIHVDFLSLREGHKITVTVPIVLSGTSEAVKLGQGILNQTLYELELECLPTDIPDSVSIDISSLREGLSLHASDITLPTNSVLVSDSGLTVVTLITKLEEIVAAAPVAAAAVEGQPAAEGAAADAAPAGEKEGEGAEKGKGKGKDKS